VAVRPLPARELDELEFRYRDGSRTVTRVRLLHELLRPRAVDFGRTRPPGSWLLRFPRPDSDRFEYQLELTRRDGSVEVVCDPLNPLRAPGPFGEKSVLEFRGYRPPEWLDEDAPPGELETVAIESRALRTTLQVPIWTATGGSPGEKLPVLVVHDGPEYAAYSSLLRYLDAAWADGRVPTMRAALLPPPGNRNESYSASARYARALMQDILPALAEAAPAPGYRAPLVGMGASLGALAMLHAHRFHPQSFGALFLQSGSFFRQRFDPQESRFVRFRRISRFVGEVLAGKGWFEPVPIAMTCGTAEENLANNRALARALAKQGYNVSLHDHRDAHSWVGWRDAFDPYLARLLQLVWA
jgi:enterochelin esterase-like enzyme